MNENHVFRPQVISLSTRAHVGLPRMFRLAVLLGCLSALLPVTAAPTDTAADIYRESGVQGGLIVQLEFGDGDLALALCRSSAFTVDYLAREAARIEAARAEFANAQPAGVLGARAWTETALPYADGLVNLLVVGNGDVVATAEAMRVLAPRGVLLVRKGDGWEKTVKPWPEELGEWSHWLHGADCNPVAQDQRIGPPRAVQWVASPLWSKSHDAYPSVVALVSAGGRIFYIVDKGPVGIGAPDGSLEDWHVCARDGFNGHVLWERPLTDWGSRAWSPGKGVVRGAGPWTGNPRDVHKRMVAAGDSVFVTLGFKAPVSRLDAATGNVLATYAGTECTTEMVLDGKMLFLGVDVAGQAAGKYTDAPAKSVVAVDTSTGKTLWRTDGFHGVEDQKPREFDGKLTRLSLTAGGGQVFVYEGDEVVALDAATGKERWRAPGPERREIVTRYRARMGKEPPENVRKREAAKKLYWWVTLHDDWGELMYSDGVVYCWRPHARAVGWQHEMEMVALSSNDGQKLWNKTCSGAGHYTLVSVFKAQGLLWVNSNVPDDLLWGLDPKTGEIVKNYDLSDGMSSVHHHRCYRAKATENYLLYSRNGVELVDFASGKISSNHWIRGICAYGIMPANGLIYTPPQPCSCTPSARAGGFVAYGPRRETNNDRAISADKRVTRGTEADKPAPAEPSGATAHSRAEPPGRPGPNPLPVDTPIPWGMYRQDAQRCASTNETVATELAKRWESDLSEPITALTIGLGKVFTAGRRTLRIRAMDIKTGERAWSFAADGAVDSPPTIRGDSVYFGTHDGYVYRLRASDGRMIWRFDANPSRTLIMVHDRLESAWPIFGSVVVENGEVYAAAGRSSYLDGGLHVYAIDAKTGAMLRHFNHCSTTDEAFAETRWRGRPSTIEGRNEAVSIGTRNDIKTSGKGGRWLLMSGGQNDLLTLDDTGLHMKNFSLDPATFTPEHHHWVFTGARKEMEKHIPGGRLRSVGGFLDGSLFSRAGYVLDEKLKARLMVFDENTMYALGWGHKGTTFDFHGLLSTDNDRYEITAHKRGEKEDKTASAKGKKHKKSLKQPSIWSLEVPVRVQAMALAGNALFVAGCPFDPAAPQDLLEGTRGKGPGMLWVIDREKGSKLSEHALSAPPVWDGLAIADNSLFIALRNGKVVRLGQ